MLKGVTSASSYRRYCGGRSGRRRRRRDTGKLCTGGRGRFGGRIHGDSGGRNCEKHIGQSFFRRRTRPRAYPRGRRCVRSHRLDSRKPRCQRNTRSGWRRLYFRMVGHRGGPGVSRSGGPPLDHISHVPRTLARMNYTSIRRERVTGVRFHRALTMSLVAAQASRGGRLRRAQAGRQRSAHPIAARVEALPH